MTFHRVEGATQLAEGEGMAVEIAGRAVALFRSGGRFYALDNACPHAGAALADGRVTAEFVACPLHGAKFALASGQCRGTRLGGALSVAAHRVRIVEGRVEVAIGAPSPG